MRDVRFLELHADLFHAGKNFGKKLVPKNLSGMRLAWDEKNNWFEITWNNRTGYIFNTNCAFVEFEEGTEIVNPKNDHKTTSVDGFRKAQVETPMSHVFEGRGKGRVNDRVNK